MAIDEARAGFSPYAPVARRIATSVEAEEAGELAVHLNAWGPLAAKQGRELTLDDARAIRRNLGSLLLELREANKEPRP